MPIVDRQFTYHGRIKVSSADMALAKLGKKRCTIRLGKLNVAGDVKFLTDGKEKVRIQVVSVDNDRTFGELTVEDALAEGFMTLGELQEDLRTYYKSIENVQPITVIGFTIIEDAK